MGSRALAFVAITAVGCAPSPPFTRPPGTARPVESTPPSRTMRIPDAAALPWFAPSQSSARIVVFSATWCQACKALEAQLDARRVLYETCDIDANADEWARAREWVGIDAVPITRIDRDAERHVAFVVGAVPDLVERMRDVDYGHDLGASIVLVKGAKIAAAVRRPGERADVFVSGSFDAESLAFGVRARRLLSPKTSKQRASLASRIDHLRFEGAVRVPTALLAHTADETPLPLDTRAHSADLQQVLWRVQRVLYDRGFADASLSRATIDPAPTGGASVTLHVSEGALWRVGTIRVVESGGTRAWRGGDVFRLRAGDAFSTSLWSNGMRAIERAYRDAGYFDMTCDVANAVKRDRGSEKDVDFTVTVKRGPFVRIERVAIEAPDEATRRRVASLVSVNAVVPGAPCSERALEAVRERLKREFARVDVSVKNAAPARAVVTFEVE